MNGYGLVIIPASWRVGIMRKAHKTLWAFGPFRLVHYRIQGAWGPTSASQ